MADRGAALLGDGACHRAVWGWPGAPLVRAASSSGILGRPLCTLGGEDMRDDEAAGIVSAEEEDLEADAGPAEEAAAAVADAEEEEEAPPPAMASCWCCRC